MTLPADTVARTSGIRVSSCSTDATSTWPVVGQPYTVEDVRIESGGNLTLPAGARLNFQTNTGLTVESGGTLTAQGTAGARVELVGGWAGIVAEAGSTVSLDHTLILGGGNTLPHRANIAALGPISMTNSFVTNSAGWGLKKAASDTTDYLTGNTFMNNASGNITNLP